MDIAEYYHGIHVIAFSVKAAKMADEDENNYCTNVLLGR